MNPSVASEPGAEGWSYRFALRQGHASTVVGVARAYGLAWQTPAGICTTNTQPVRPARGRRPPDCVCVAVVALRPRMKRRQIAETFGFKRRSVEKWLERAEARGLARGNSLTHEGAELLRELGGEPEAILTWWAAVKDGSKRAKGLEPSTLSLGS